MCKEIGNHTPVRFTVVLPNGRVIGDSMTDPSAMENHIDRPEIRRALNGENFVVTRFSFTLNEPMMYAAAPLRKNGKVIAAIRTSFPSDITNRTLRSFLLHTILGGLLLALLALGVSIILSLRLKKTFREMQQGAARFSAGELEYRLHIKSFVEIESLAEAMNSMADQISRRIQTITTQRNELEAVLSGMTEAVIAVDADERIINANHAAESLFRISLSAARGRTIQETIRNSRLQAFIKKALAGDIPQLEDTIMEFQPERFLQAHGNLLRDSGSRVVGAIFVLNDITRLKKLENIRRDFVANVSHELKTPITSIRGFVETLRDGALDDRSSAARFLDIILAHANRLNAIVDDLLSLSRLEQEADREAIPFETVPAMDIVKNAVQVCESKAGEKKISIKISGDEAILLRGNSDLLEQAVVNLVDNAIKYSDSGGDVSVSVQEAGNEILITVEDHGIGIPEKFLPRVFERFYRVEKARSRDSGGTGLGLAIVKHIVQAHKGRISVVSAQGKGSVFTLRFPACRRESVSQ